MPDAQHIVLDTVQGPARTAAPFATAPMAAPLTRAEARALRTVLADRARRLRRIALVVLPLATGIGATLLWTLFADVVPSEITNDGRFSASEIFPLMVITVVWEAAVVWTMWDEALAVAPGPPLALPTPREVTAQVVASFRRYRFRKGTLRRVRFPTHWTPPRGRVRLRFIVPPRRRWWPQGRFGRSPLVLDAEAEAAGPPAASQPAAFPSAGPRSPAPTHTTPRGQWIWDPRRHALVPVPQPPPSSTVPPPAAGRPAPAERAGPAERQRSAGRRRPLPSPRHRRWPSCPVPLVLNPSLVSLRPGIAQTEPAPQRAVGPCRAA